MPSRTRDRTDRSVANIVGGTVDWYYESVCALQNSYRLNIYYCQQVCLHCGGWHSCGCAGLNLHWTKSHLISTNFSNKSPGLRNQYYLFVFLLQRATRLISPRFPQFMENQTRFCAWPHLQHCQRKSGGKLRETYFLYTFRTLS